MKLPSFHRNGKSKDTSDEKPNSNGKHGVLEAHGDDALLVNVLDQYGLVDRLAPTAMNFTVPDCCQFSATEWVRAWYARDWPITVGFDHWKRLLNFPGDVRVSLFMNPLPPALVSKQLERQATAIQASRFVRLFQRRDPSPSEDHDYQQIMIERQRVEVAGEPFYFLTAVLGIVARSKDDLNEWSERLEQLCQDAGIIIDRALWQQEEGLESLLPLNSNRLGNHQRNATLDTLCRMFPFVGDEIVMPDGVFYGFNSSNGTAIVLDPFALTNPNTVIVGIPGGGKSYFMKDLLEQYLLAGVRVYIIDIEEEYKALCDDLGGLYLDMGIKSAHRINVLDPDPYDTEGLASAYQSFKGWMVTALERRLAPQESEALDRAYLNCFKEFGITKEDNDTLWRTPPRLEHLHKHLITLGTPAALTLASTLSPMTSGMDSEAFNCDTTVRDIWAQPLVVFGLKDVPEAMKPRRIRQIQQFTWNQMLRGLRRTIEIVDEAWHLLQNDATAQDLAERARRFRKKNGALILATQHVDDFAANRHAATVLSLASTHLLFLQQDTSTEQIAGLFKLNAAEASRLTSLLPGEFLLRTNRAKMLCYKPVPPERHMLYTTRPDEVLAAQTAQAATVVQRRTQVEGGGA